MKKEAAYSKMFGMIGKLISTLKSFEKEHGFREEKMMNNC